MGERPEESSVTARRMELPSRGIKLAQNHVMSHTLASFVFLVWFVRFHLTLKLLFIHVRSHPCSQDLGHWMECLLSVITAIPFCSNTSLFSSPVSTHEPFVGFLFVFIFVRAHPYVLKLLQRTGKTYGMDRVTSHVPKSVYMCVPCIT